MANVKATMTDIRVIIREFSRGTSLREMERKLMCLEDFVDAMIQYLPEYHSKVHEKVCEDGFKFVTESKV